MKKCFIAFCRNHEKSDPNLKFFTMGARRYVSWMKALGRDPLREKLSYSNIICSEHFDPKDFIICSGRIHLKKSAVPSRKLRPSALLPPVWSKTITVKLSRKPETESESHDTRTQSVIELKSYASLTQLEIEPESYATPTLDPLEIEPELYATTLTQTDTEPESNCTQPEIGTESDATVTQPDVESESYATPSQPEIEPRPYDPSYQLVCACKYPNCKNAYYRSRKPVRNKHFYTFPKDPQLHKQWKKICLISDFVNSKSYRLCDDHFERKDFVNESKHRLNPNVVPKSFIPDELLKLSLDKNSDSTSTYNPENILISNKLEFLKQGSDAVNLATQVNSNPKGLAFKLVENNVSIKLEELRHLFVKKNNSCNLKYLYKCGFLKQMEIELSILPETMFQKVTSFSEPVNAAEDWTTKDKAFWLSVFKKSPRLYEVLEKRFGIPYKYILENILMRFPFESGISEQILHRTKLQVAKLKTANRYCVLMFDEIVLRPQDADDPDADTSQVLVFMARGIRKPWKQLIGYYFTKIKLELYYLRYLIKQTIVHLQSVGLIVVGTVCDQRPHFQSVLTQLCSEQHPKQSPYCFFVDNQPVVTIYDVPHLLKNTRDALFSSRIIYEVEHVADCKHIKDCFALDQQRPIHCLTKLQKSYFLLKDPSVNSNVQVAAAQLSTTMAGLLCVCSQTPNLSADAIYTAGFICKVDTLFDSLNGSQLTPSDVKPYRCVLRNDSPHLELWPQVINELSKWKLLDCEKTNHFNRGWQTTIKAVRCLWKDIISQVDEYYFLNLRNLNQDPLDNFLCTLRGYGIGSHTTCEQFTDIVKSAILNNMAYPTEKANCEDDLCEMLDNYDDILERD